MGISIGNPVAVGDIVRLGAASHGVIVGQQRHIFEWSDFAKTRASEGAAVDLRIGWAYYDVATPHPGVNVPRVLPDNTMLIEGSATNRNDLGSQDMTGWALDGTPLLSLVAGPDGGAATATRIEDDDGAATEGIYNDLVTVIGTAYAVHAKVKKDSDVSRFVALAVVESGTGAASRALQINTSTGAVVDYGADAFSTLVVLSAGDWWHVSASYDAVGTAAQAILQPAAGTVWGVASVAATGAAIFSDFQLEAVGTAPPSAPSSPIRTSVAAVVRQPDIANLVLTAAQAVRFQDPGGFWFDFWSGASSVDVDPGGGNKTLFDVGVALLRLYRTSGTSTWQFQVNTIISTAWTGSAWNRGDHFRVWVSCPVGSAARIQMWNITQGLASGIFTHAQSAVDLTGQGLQISGYYPSPTGFQYSAVYSLPIVGAP